MVLQVSTDVRGRAQLAEAMRQLGNDLETSTSRYRRCANILRNNLRRVAPVRTGAMKRGFRAYADRNSGWVSAGRKGWYVYPVDRGHVRARAYPFLERASQAAWPEILAEIGKEVDAAGRKWSNNA